MNRGAFSRLVRAAQQVSEADEDLLNGLTRQQRTFLLEKLLGLNDKDAALAAGYSRSIAENTKQKIWAKPGVRDEFARLRGLLESQRPAPIAVPSPWGSENPPAKEVRPC